MRERGRGISSLGGEQRLSAIVYGRDVVMGEYEPLRHVLPHEVGLLGEVTADTQELAIDLGP